MSHHGRVTARPSVAAVVGRLTVVAAGVALSVSALAPPAGASQAHAPLESATSSPAGSWVIVPMGHISDRADTFWQVLHATASSSHWSVVTPPGVADNGGLAMGVSGGSALVGFLPSALLHFSPLSSSGDAGTTWSPVFLPGALVPVPDALALAPGNPSTALALAGGRVLSAGPGLSSWTALVSLQSLRRASPRCGATALDATAYATSGSPLVAVACGRGGVVGIFSGSGGHWRAEGPVLGGALVGSSTTVLRLETASTTSTALVEANREGRRWLLALWRSGTRWSASQPLALTGRGTVLATALGSNGTLAVLARVTDTREVESVAPGQAWTALPAPPANVVALAWSAPSSSGLGPSTADAFTVNGTVLDVFALAPAGARWVKVQTARVPLAYGSSG